MIEIILGVLCVLLFWGVSVGIQILNCCHIISTEVTWINSKTWDEAASKKEETDKYLRNLRSYLSGKEEN